VARCADAPFFASAPRAPRAEAGVPAEGARLVRVLRAERGVHHVLLRVRGQRRRGRDVLRRLGHGHHRVRGRDGIRNRRDGRATVARRVLRVADAREAHLSVHNGPSSRGGDSVHHTSPSLELGRAGDDHRDQTDRPRRRPSRVIRHLLLRHERLRASVRRRHRRFAARGSEFGFYRTRNREPHTRRGGIDGSLQPPRASRRDAVRRETY
jgi:hypothetical protein